MKTITGFGFPALALALVGAPAALAAPVYRITALGLDDPEHMRNDGSISSFVDQGSEFNEAGQVTGIASRYNGGSTWLGRSAWLYDGAKTIKLGLTGPEQTRNDGWKSSTVIKLTELGKVLG